MSVELREGLYRKIAEDLGIAPSLVRKIAQSQQEFIEHIIENEFSFEEVIEINLFCFGKFRSVASRIEHIRRIQADQMAEIVFETKKEPNNKELFLL